MVPPIVRLIDDSAPAVHPEGCADPIVGLLLLFRGPLALYAVPISLAPGTEDSLCHGSSRRAAYQLGHSRVNMILRPQVRTAQHMLLW